MRITTSRWATGFGVTALLLLAASQANAQQVLCTTTPAGWNVPAGDPVFVSGPGPIYSVLSSVGEYRSHSMLSRGPDGWVTHATSITPPTNGDMSPYLTPFCSSCGSECWNPIQPSFLYNSMPGLATISQGAAYAFLYNGGSANLSTGVGPGENFIAYQRAYSATPTAQQSANQATLANNMLGPGMAWAGWWSGSSSVGNQSNWSTDYTYIWGTSYNGSQIHYGWYQYMNVQSVPQGVPGVDTGVVCSSSLAMWQHDSLSSQPGYTGDVLPRTYNNLSGAANALWNGVQSECSSTTGWFASVGSFFLNLAWSALCVGSSEDGEGVCSSAADQMANCFTANQCGNTSSPGSYGNNKNWQSVVSSGASAVGISPDDIGCWDNPANGTGAPCSGTGSSIWGWDVNQTVQWNSGGNQYGCWN
jgi:hypothetical protein